MPVFEDVFESMQDNAGEGLLEHDSSDTGLGTTPLSPNRRESADAQSPLGGSTQHKINRNTFSIESLIPRGGRAPEQLLQDPNGKP